MEGLNGLSRFAEFQVPLAQQEPEFGILSLRCPELFQDLGGLPVPAHRMEGEREIESNARFLRKFRGHTAVDFHSLRIAPGKHGGPGPPCLPVEVCLEGRRAVDQRQVQKDAGTYAQSP